jgi:hypothetical protein
MRVTLFVTGYCLTVASVLFSLGRWLQRRGGISTFFGIVLYLVSGMFFLGAAVELTAYLRGRQYIQ